MLSDLAQAFAKVRENNAFAALMHPEVLANFALYRWESSRRPLTMRAQPIAVEIELTNRCNLACVQCLRSRGLKPYALGEMRFDTFRRVLAQFPYLLSLSLNGFGEALRHERFFDIVAYSRETLPWAKIGIYSNGLLIDDAVADRLVHSGLTEINVSIDAAMPDTYRRVRRGGKLADVHAGLSRLVHARNEAGRQRPMVGVNFVLLNENRGELVPFIEQAAGLGVDFVNCITYATYDWGFQNQRTAEDYAEELAGAKQRLAELGLRCKSFPSGDLGWSEAQTPFDCSFFWGSDVRVAFSGDVTLGCCTPFKETYTYGNLLDIPFEYIWNNTSFRRNRARARRHQPPNEVCASCDRFTKSFFAHETPATALPMYPVSSV